MAPTKTAKISRFFSASQDGDNASNAPTEKKLNRRKKSASPLPSSDLAKERKNQHYKLPRILATEDGDLVDYSNCDNVYYPTDPHIRRDFKTKDGKTVTLHQWAIYDFIRKIPAGNVTTYKNIAEQLGEGSPRSVGQAMRHNPFAPYVPCHRVVASDLGIGGFFGEWDKNGAKSGAAPGVMVARKIEMLRREGVNVEKGRVAQTSLWAISG